MESWMLLPFNNNYAVSNYENVKNVRKDKMLQLATTPSGYASITIGRKTMQVHRLVGLMFVPNPQNKPYINHIDGNKLNNYFLNLEWCTAKENDFHARELGLKGFSGCVNDNRPVILTDMETNQTYTFRTIGHAALFLNTNKGSLYRVLNKKRNQHRGFTASYL